MRILLVEDDLILGEGIAVGLRQIDAIVDWFPSAADAMVALATESFSVVVLNIGLPGMSGLQLLESLRRQGNRTSVLLLTARDTVRDRVHGLNVGADDYLVKPFDLSELSARLQALARRATGHAPTQLALGGLVIDFAARTCVREAVPVEPSRREFAVLQVLVEHLGTVLSRQRIEQALYARGEEVESNTIKVHIHHLRKRQGSAAGIRSLRRRRTQTAPVLTGVRARSCVPNLVRQPAAAIAIAQCASGGAGSRGSIRFQSNNDHGRSLARLYVARPRR